MSKITCGLDTFRSNFYVWHLVLLVEYIMKEIQPINSQLYCGVCDGNYMFRLSKVAIVRLCKSDVYKGELLVAILRVRFKAADIVLLFTLLLYTVCWWLLYVAVTCSCRCNHRNKVAHWRGIFLSLTMYFCSKVTRLLVVPATGPSFIASTWISWHLRQQGTALKAKGRTRDRQRLRCKCLWCPF